MSLPFVIKKSASSALHLRLLSKHNAKTRVASTGNYTTLTTYPHILSYLLPTYAIDENIADTGDEITTIIQPLNKTPSQHTEELMVETLRCGDFFNEQDLGKIFSKRLEKFIRQFMREKCSMRKVAGFHNLAFHASSLLKLQYEHKGVPSTNSGGNKKQNRRRGWQTRDLRVYVVTSSGTGTNFI